MLAIIANYPPFISRYNFPWGAHKFFVDVIFAAVAFGLRRLR